VPRPRHVLEPLAGLAIGELGLDGFEDPAVDEQTPSTHTGDGPVSDVRDEVRTRQALPEALASGTRIVVPYCLDGELELFWLENMDELELGMYRILEPKVELPNQYRISTKHQKIDESLQNILVLIVYCSVEHEEKSDGQGGPNGNLPEVTLKAQCAIFFKNLK
jgi:hypothetical protein